MVRYTLKILQREACMIFKVCLTIFGRYAQKISIFFSQSFPEPVLKKFPERQRLRSLQKLPVKTTGLYGN